MAVLDALLGPITGLIDKLIPDPKARQAAKLELIRLQGTQELEQLKAQLSAIVAEAGSNDPWTSRARPSFLYVMYALLLWSIPMGLISVARPEAASASKAWKLPSWTSCRSLAWSVRPPGPAAAVSGGAWGAPALC